MPNTTFKEYALQKAICKYIEIKYPHVLFLSDTVASVRLTPQQGARNKAIQKRDFSCPDLIILQPNDKFHGLMMELKVNSPYTKEGNLKKQSVEVKVAGKVVDKYDHLEEQDRALRKLRERGYWADFVWSIDDAMRIIDKYLEDKL
jgi:hypothetical protein